MSGKCFFIIVFMAFTIPLKAQFTAKNDVKMVIEGFQDNIVYRSSEMLVGFDKKEKKVEFRVKWKSFRPADSSSYIPLDSMFNFPENSYLAIKSFYSPFDTNIDNQSTVTKTFEGIISIYDHKTIKRFPISLFAANDNLVLMNSVIHFELRNLNIPVPEKYKGRLTGHIHLVMNRIKWLDH